MIAMFCWNVAAVSVEGSFRKTVWVWAHCNEQLWMWLYSMGLGSVQCATLNVAWKDSMGLGSLRCATLNVTCNICRRINQRDSMNSPLTAPTLIETQLDQPELLSQGKFKFQVHCNVVINLLQDLLKDQSQTVLLYCKAILQMWLQHWLKMLFATTY